MAQALWITLCPVVPLPRCPVALLPVGVVFLPPRPSFLVPGSVPPGRRQNSVLPEGAMKATVTQRMGCDSLSSFSSSSSSFSSSSSSSSFYFSSSYVSCYFSISSFSFSFMFYLSCPVSISLFLSYSFLFLISSSFPCFVFSLYISFFSSSS